VGKRVTLIDNAMQSLESAEKFIVGYIQGQLAKGRLDPDGAKELELRIIFSSSFEDVEGARERLLKIMEVINPIRREELLKNISLEYLHRDLTFLIKDYFDKERQIEM